MPYSGVPKGSETEKKIERCVKEVMKKNPSWDKSRAIATCRKSIEKKEAEMTKTRQKRNLEDKELLKAVNAGVPLDELYDDFEEVQDKSDEHVPESLDELLEEFEYEDEEVEAAVEEVEAEIEQKPPEKKETAPEEEPIEQKPKPDEVVMDILGVEPEVAEEKEVDEAFDYDLVHTEILLDMVDKSLSARLIDWFEKAKLTSSARSKLSNSDFALIVKRDDKKVRKFPIHDKSHVRNALARAAQMIKEGGQAAEDARAALPKIRKAAKKFGIGKPSEKNANAIIVHKDAETDTYRFVGWVSGKWKDREGEIISEAAHKEFEQFLNDTPEWTVSFRSWHVPGTERTTPIDFWSYVNGFVIVSGELNEKEAVGLMKAMRKHKLGMSHGFFGVKDPSDPNVIIKYRTFEVSDLPLDNAAFAWSDLSTIMEAKKSMNTQLDYLSETVGRDILEKILADGKLKKTFLESVGIEEKSFDAYMAGEEVDEPETETKETEDEVEVDQLSPEMVALLKESLGLGDIDVTELKETLEKAKGALALMPVMAEKIDTLSKELEDANKDSVQKLSDLIAGDISKRKSVMDNRPSQKKDNVADEDDPINDSLPKHENTWLSEVSNTTPVGK